MNILEGIPEEKLTPHQENIAEPDVLVLYNLREAFFYARGCYQSRYLSEGETLSACYEALTAAAKNFKPDRIRFFGYAKAYIRGTLSKNSMALVVVKKSAGIETLPSESEDDDDKSVELPTRQGWVGDTKPYCSPEFDLVYLKEEWAAIAPLLRTVLNDKQRMIIELNFFGGFNLQQIGDMLGLTRALAHHTKQTALKKIRNYLMEKNLWTASQ